MASEIASLVKNILKDISSSNNDNLELNLERLPISVIDKISSEKIFAKFMKKSYDSQNIKAARIIIETFDRLRVNADFLPALTDMFLNPLLTREVLSFAVVCFPEKTHIGYLIDLINSGDDRVAIKIASILSTYLPTLSHDEWELLVKFTDDVDGEPHDNQMLRSYLKTMLGESLENTYTPEWIVDEKFYLEKVPNYIPSVKDAVDILLENFSKDKISLNSIDDNKSIDINQDEVVKNLLISQYAMSSIKEKIQMVNLNIEISETLDVSLFREFGPVNTIYTNNPSLLGENNICSKHGGCRMFLCTEFELEDAGYDGYDEDEDYEREWFIGKCEICENKISHKKFSLRKPLKQGGWLGCYCSFKCLEKRVSDPITSLMVGRMKEQLDFFKISSEK